MFGSKTRALIKQQSELIGKQRNAIAEFEVQVSEQNQLYKSLYSFLQTGSALSRDSRVGDYIKQGYEGNPDVFSIVMKVASLFAQTMSKARIIKVVNRKEI